MLGMETEMNGPEGMTSLLSRESEKISMIDRALVFAVMKHAGQRRKGSQVPYITHVVEAMGIVAEIRLADEQLQIAALLHDTLEDTDTTKEELGRLFGPRVAQLVAEESENKRIERAAKDTWKERKQETIDHLKEASTEVQIVALGDKLSNIRAMARDYRSLGDRLWDRFNQKDPKEHGWYYGSIAKIFGEDEEIRETGAYEEYVRLCTEVFGAESVK